MAPNVSKLNCSDVLNFTYESEEAKANLSNDISKLKCTFDVLAYILIYNPNDPVVKYPNVLYMTNATESVQDSFKKGLVNFTISKDIVTLDCNGAGNL